MRRYLLIVLALCLLLLAVFLVASALEVPYLTDTRWLSAHAAPAAAAIANALLVVDVLLPVPSSFLMIANGALLGLLPGALASLGSATLSALLAFGLGRRSAPWLLERIPPAERQRADRFFQRWGAAAVIMTRPVPILAETMGVVAGTTRLSWPRFASAAVVGNLPPAALYAYAGATARSAEYGLLIPAVLIGVTALWWALVRRAERRSG